MTLFILHILIKSCKHQPFSGENLVSRNFRETIGQFDRMRIPLLDSRMRDRMFWSMASSGDKTVRQCGISSSVRIDVFISELSLCQYSLRTLVQSCNLDATPIASNRLIEGHYNDVSKIYVFYTKLINYVHYFCLFYDNSMDAGLLLQYLR